jgi:hypothetical protein
MLGARQTPRFGSGLIIPVNTSGLAAPSAEGRGPVARGKGDTIDVMFNSPLEQLRLYVFELNALNVTPDTWDLQWSKRARQLHDATIAHVMIVSPRWRGYWIALPGEDFPLAIIVCHDWLEQSIWALYTP